MSSSRKSQHSCQRLRVKTSKCCVEQKFISGTRNYIPSCIDSSAEEINDQEAIFKSNNGWISDNQKCNFLTTFCLVFWIWLKLYFGYEVLQFSRSIICVIMFRIKEWMCEFDTTCGFALELAIRHSATVITHGAQPEPREFQPGPSAGAPEAAAPVAANRGACWWS